MAKKKKMEWKNATRVPAYPKEVKEFDDMIDHLVQENKITDDEAFILYYLTTFLLQKERQSTMEYCSSWGRGMK